MNCLTWNHEYSSARDHPGGLNREAIDTISPNVICNTEVLRDFVPEGHRFEADAD